MTSLLTSEGLFSASESSCLASQRFFLASESWFSASESSLETVLLWRANLRSQSQAQRRNRERVRTKPISTALHRRTPRRDVQRSNVEHPHRTTRCRHTLCMMTVLGFNANEGVAKHSTVLILMKQVRRPHTQQTSLKHRVSSTDFRDLANFVISTQVTLSRATRKCE